MICSVQALNFRCLRYVDQELDRFHVLIGPNASGKTTFLEVVRFLGDLVGQGLEAAISARTDNLQDLTWGRTGHQFELAVELAIPAAQRELLPGHGYQRCRYEVGIGIDPTTHENALLGERVLLGPLSAPTPPRPQLNFPCSFTAPSTILTSRQAPTGWRTVVNKVSGGNDNFYDETGKGWDHAFRLGPQRSALANLPEDETKFPVSTWLKRVLADGVQPLSLNSALMRQASPPGQPRGFRVDGSNLPWVVEALGEAARSEWLAHVRTALPDLTGVRTILRPEDRHRYLVLEYENGLEVPSWTASDGTLRLLALSLLAYVPDLTGVFLIEEPENGIHPRAVQTVFQSLSSVYGAQVLLATHSPVILSLAEPDQVLCFARTTEGGTDIVRGSAHPALREWKGEPGLGVLYGAGVLG